MATMFGSADKWVDKNQTPDYMGSIAVVEKLTKELTPDGRVVLWERLQRGYCRDCGEKLDAGGRCRGCAAGEEGLAYRNAGY